MNLDDRLIPHVTSDLPKGRWLVFSTKPSVELLGMGGALARAARDGIQVTIVYIVSAEDKLTDESMRTAAVSVCEELSAKSVFLEISESELTFSSDTLRKFTDVVAKNSGHHLFFPSPLEFQSSHRVVAALVWRAIQIHKNDIAGAFSYEISRQSDANLLVDVTSEYPEKLRLIDMYKSYMAIDKSAAVAQSLNQLRTFSLGEKVEYAEAFCRYDYFWGLLKNIHSNLQHLVFEDILPQDRPKISIIIRTQNRLTTLRRAIESVKAQGYNQFIELVVVNDGGESIKSVTDDYSDYFSDIKIIEIPSCKGRSAAANAGLINATGHFLNFLDDDDEFLSGHIDSFLNNWRRSPEYKVFYRGVDVVSAKGESVMTYNEPFRAEKLIHTNYIPIHSVTFSRYFVDIGCRFDESLEYMEDWDFWIQLSRLAPFKHVNRITARYHLVGSSSATPEMRCYLDNAGHMNRVRDKWVDKWSAVERNRMVAALLSDAVQQ